MRQDKPLLDVFPAFYKVRERKVMVVGGGDEAAAKIRLLIQTSAHICLIGQPDHPEIEAGIAAGDIHHLGVDFKPELIEDAALVFAVADDEERLRQVRQAALAHGVAFNAVDRPELCDFYVGAMVNRAPVAVAISSSGTGPVLARLIRARIEAMLPRSTGGLAILAEEFRSRLKALISDARSRRRYWQTFFTGRVSAYMEAGKNDAARREAADLLEKTGPASGYVHLVGAGPGAEDLLTLRAQRLLQEADIILYDFLVPEAVVAMGRRDAERMCVASFKGKHVCSQSDVNGLMIEKARAGNRVVRLKFGDPMLFAQGREELRALRQADIPHEVAPGISAGSAASAMIKLPLFLQDMASQRIFADIYDWKKGADMPRWAALAIKGEAVALNMDRGMAPLLACRLIQSGLPADTPIAIVENISHDDEALKMGRLDTLAHFKSVAGGEESGLIIIGNALLEADLRAAKALEHGGSAFFDQHQAIQDNHLASAAA